MIIGIICVLLFVVLISSGVYNLIQKDKAKKWEFKLLDISLKESYNDFVNKLMFHDFSLDGGLYVGLYCGHKCSVKIDEYNDKILRVEVKLHEDIPFHDFFEIRDSFKLKYENNIGYEYGVQELNNKFDDSICMRIYSQYKLIIFKNNDTEKLKENDRTEKLKSFKL